MIPGQYPTSGDVKVFIDGKWVDDTLRVSVEEECRKVPLWGYHQKFMGGVADGKMIVTGTLAIHFRFPGYLMYAIQGIVDRRKMQEADRLMNAEQRGPDVQGAPQAVSTQTNPYDQGGRGAQSTIALIQSLRRMSPEERATAILEAGNDFQRQSDLLESMFIQRASQDDSTPVGDNPVELSPEALISPHGGFEIELVYAKTETPQGSFFVRERILGVHLTGSRKVITAGIGGSDLGGSGQSLIEVYPFLAKKVVRYAAHESDVTSANYGLANQGGYDSDLGLSDPFFDP